MEINPFILALSKTLPESCLQGLVVYLLLQLLFFIDKRSTPLLRFNAFYLANLCLFAGFVYTFFHHYQQIQVAFFDPNLLPNVINTNHPASAIEPGLWLQFSFWTNRYAYLITGFYLLGLLFCILKLTIGLINISWFRSNKNLKLDNYLTQISIQLSSNFRLIKTVSVFVSDQIFVPLTLGFIKPIIVFPIALVNQLSAEQTEAILLHELAHIKRNDYLLNILLCIVQSFLFFNPAIWLMKREINKFREQCCDDLVLDNTAHKIAYARALLLIEASRSTPLTLALASNGKKYTLLNRIKRITNMKMNDPSPQNKFVVLLLALIVIGLTVAWNMPVKKVVKRFAIERFKAKKEARNTGKIEQFTDVYHDAHAPLKKDKHPNKKTSIQFFDDITTDTTIKSKNKFKIVLEDSLGNKKEYNSVEELPEDVQKDFLKQNEKFDNKFNNVTFTYKHPDSSKYSYHAKIYDFKDLKEHADEIRKMEEKREHSPEFKKQMEAMRKKFNSPEWKKQTELMRKKGEEIRKQFNSPEWKKQMEDIRKQGEEMRRQFDGPEYKKKMEEMVKQFDSPEYKKKMEEMVKQFNSPEYKKKMEEMVKYYQSPEWKKYEKQMLKYYNSPEWKKYEKQMLKNYNGFDTIAIPKKENLN